MYVQRTTNGKYQFFESYVDPLTLARKTVSVTLPRNTNSSRKTAQALLYGKISEKTAICTPTTDATLKSLFTAYLASYTCRASTRRGVERDLAATLDILGEHTIADRMTVKYICSRFDAAPGTPLTKNAKLKRLRHVLTWAERRDLVGDISYIKKVPLYEYKSQRQTEDKYLEREELEALVNAMDDEFYKTVTLFLALTGMRIGEAIGLHEDDVDLEKRTISIRREFNLVTRAEAEPKTKDSRRTIYIQDELLEVCQSIKPKNGFYLSRSGRRLCYNAFHDYLQEVSASIGKPITPHALRHTHTSLLAEQGLPLDLISRRLGHKSTAVTRDIYLHVTSGMIERENSRLKNIRFL